MTKTYGVISDLHQIDLRAVPLAIKILIKEEVDALVLNGDLMGELSGYNPQEYLATVLDLAGQSGLETYVLRGSHEEVHLCEPVVAHFVKRHGNIIDALKNPLIDQGDHHLVFLSGSDWRSGNAVHRGYSLQDQNPSGIYAVRKDSDQEVAEQEDNLCVINIHDLKKLVSVPDKTILFSHVPRRFNHSELAVDRAEFWETMQPFRLDGKVCEAGSVFPGPAGSALAKRGAPLRLKRINRGNELLKSIYEELGITKNITGHFHESAGKANDLDGQAVEEGLFASDLFYNASCLDRLMVGMVSVDEAKAAYENINLKKILKSGYPYPEG